MDTSAYDGGPAQSITQSAQPIIESVATTQTTQTTQIAGIDVQFTVAQLCTLLMLRRSYGPSFDTFSAREMAHLRLYRWLYEAGRLEG